MKILRNILATVRAAKNFGLMCDEAVDSSRKEQLSLNVRIVSPDLTPNEFCIPGFDATNACTVLPN